MLPVGSYFAVFWSHFRENQRKSENETDRSYIPISTASSDLTIISLCPVHTLDEDEASKQYSKSLIRPLINKLKRFH